MIKKSPYKRILLKLSGESLTGDNASCALDHTSVVHIGSVIVELHHLGLEMGVVIGGGNIFRGAQANQFGFKKTPADHIGMLATAINGLALAQVISSMGRPVRVMSAISLGSIAEPYNWTVAQSYLKDGYIVIFVGGTGNPYFTTDTAAALRAVEVDAEMIIKATTVDGVFDKDPKKHKDAKIFKTLTFQHVLENRLAVMDATAIAMCQENNIPIHVINLSSREALIGAAYGEDQGTIIRG
jgi:uridylate kinase